MSDVTKGTPIARFKRPGGLTEVKVDAFSGLLPGPGTQRTVTELYIDGTEKQLRRDDMHSAVEIDGATGLLWDNGCTGPQVTRQFLDFSGVEPRFPQWKKYTLNWAERAAKGAGVRGGPRRTATSYFFDGFVVPFGRTWGGKFPPTEVCSFQPPICEEPGGPPTPEPSIIVPCVTPEPEPTGPEPTKKGGPKPTNTPLFTLPAVPTGGGPTGAGEAMPAAAFPLLVPVFAFALARRFRPKRPERFRPPS
jgi:hypothetical protein